MTIFTKALTSSSRMRPFSPLPRTLPRFTPSSRANLRTEGLACAAPKLCSSIGGKPPRAAGAMTCCTPCGAAGRAACAAGLLGAAAGADLAGAAAAAAWPLTVTTTDPGDTLPPLATCTFSTTPLAVDGTSMVALSVSSVTSGVSKSTVSPGFTSTSMTPTESKLPMSGTLTSMELGAAATAGAGADFAAGAVAGAASAGSRSLGTRLLLVGLRPLP